MTNDIQRKNIVFNNPTNPRNILLEKLKFIERGVIVDALNQTIPTLLMKLDRDLSWVSLSFRSILYHTSFVKVIHIKWCSWDVGDKDIRRKKI
jgi:hypothetical protein